MSQFSVWNTSYFGSNLQAQESVDKNEAPSTIGIKEESVIKQEDIVTKYIVTNTVAKKEAKGDKKK